MDARLYTDVHLRMLLEMEEVVFLLTSRHKLPLWTSLYHPAHYRAEMEALTSATDYTQMYHEMNGQINCRRKVDPPRIQNTPQDEAKPPMGRLD